MRDASEEGDLIEQIGDGILMLITFAALRETLLHACRIVFRLIDLALSPEPLKIAEQLNRASDPRWSVSVLLVALPLFLIAFRMLSARLENNPLLRHGKLFIVVLVLFVLDAMVMSKLAENSRPSTAPLPLTDPESGRPYEYARIDSHRYKLCANFKLETLPTPPPVHDQTPVRGSVSPWAHSAGPHCFVFDGQSPTPLPSPMPDEARTQARRCGKARG
jgi:hypothetical protein